jgi:hypothetical protein
MMRDTRTTKDGLVGSVSLVWLAWTEWSVHHLERGRGRRGGEDDESNGKAGLKNAGPAWAAKQPTNLSFPILFSPLFPSLSPPSRIYFSLIVESDDVTDASRQKTMIKCPHRDSMSCES